MYRHKFGEWDGTTLREVGERRTREFRTEGGKFRSRG